jgi:hypothetical protein
MTDCLNLGLPSLAEGAAALVLVMTLMCGVASAQYEGV